MSLAFNFGYLEYNERRVLITGSITVIDHDTVGVSNLHRQVLHTTERVGMNKAASAALAITRFVFSG